jgi:hypothetical protein
MNRYHSKGWGKILGAAALLLAALAARDAQAYPKYDDGTSHGCVECHAGFKGGNATILHFAHVSKLGITQCNFCHPNGGGSTPVRTYTSGPGGGFGCAGCHGADYGETSVTVGMGEPPNGPKASGYGLRAYHALKGVTVCAGCHVPGALGSPMPFPAIKPESTKPPYYLMPGSNLRNPCDSSQEDFTTGEETPDSVGLDNDGNGVADWPADMSCAEPTTTTTTTSTTTTTLPVECGMSPAGGCIAAGKASLSIDEKTPGKEKLKLSLSKLVPMVAQSQFGDPVSGTTSYAVCVYNASNLLVGSYKVSRGGDTCVGEPCWSAVKTTGFKYGDKDLTADGIDKIQFGGGDAGKGKIKLSGKNSASTLPTGIAAMLNGATQATVQIVTSDSECFGMALPTVKTADGTVFKAGAP